MLETLHCLAVLPLNLRSKMFFFELKEGSLTFIFPELVFLVLTSSCYLPRDAMPCCQLCYHYACEYFCLRLTNEEIYYFLVSVLYLHWQ